MQWLIQYVKRLLAIWFTWVLLAASIIGAILLLIDLHYPTFPLPQWAFWAYIGVIFFCFLGANVRLFANLEIETQTLLQRIAELKAVEGKLRIVLRHFGFEPSRSHDSPQFRGRVLDPNGYDKDGLPDCACVWADIEIENVGYEPGELVIELDHSATELPRIFAIDENVTIQFHGSPSVKIPGRSQQKRQIMIKFAIRERNPQAFARALQTPQAYKFVLKYYTRRIGGTSEEERLVVEGDLGYFREEVIKYWRGFGFSELAEIAERQPESKRRW